MRYLHEIGLMKYLVIAVLVGLSFVSNAQKSRNFRSKSRKDLFGGAQDYREITKNALQISFGPNYTLTRLHNQTFSTTDAATNRPVDATIDPIGNFGGFIDIGMAHYRLKPSRFWSRLADRNKEGFFARRVKSNLFHRFDWGLGFAYIGGTERTLTTRYDAVGNPLGTIEDRSTFNNGYLTARVTADRFTQLNEKWHLETGLGLNFAYNILPAPHPSAYAATGNAGILVAPQKYQQDFMAQLHGHLGFNYRIRKGDYFVMGVYSPLLGFYEWNKAKPTIQWYSSNYWPISLQFKWIHHFTKKSNGCNTGTDADRKRNNEYMQNK